VNFFSTNISGEEVKSNTIVNTGVISLSTNPKIPGTFEEPVEITLQYNRVRMNSIKCSNNYIYYMANSASGQDESNPAL